jgi:dihydroorotate dehydrogenase (NAD+) catalytic subunit
MAAKPDMKVNIGGLQLQNPVLTASGTFGYGREFDHLIDLNRLGGIVVKGLSLMPAKGNPPPRIVETACGMINAIGLENVGIEAFIAEKLPFLQDLDPPVIANIYGQREEDYRQLATRINGVAAIDGIEVNISCPNVKAGGMAFGVDPRAAFSVIRAVRNQTSKPVIVKLSPNVTDITQIATAVEEAGADCISLINTISAMAVDIESRRPKIANVIGGLSGPAIKPVALRMVWQVAQKCRIPIIGIGGIMTAGDALEFFIAGATAIEVGTANFVNPRTTIEIIDGIEAFLVEGDIPSVRDIVGTLET